MRNLRVVFVFAMATCAASAAADSLPSSADDIVQRAKQECDSFENGKFHATEKAVSRYDFTGDGSAEVLVDASQFSCSTAATLWGGSGGTFLWIVAPDNTYEFLAHKWQVVDVDGQNVLLLAVHSSQCSDDVGPCFRAFVWQDGFRTTQGALE